ncbi:hypothetical protein GW17_00020370 [Ensete ventricosum]|nr:hypothetical protein GW17_00020370 [Ensete ventricosum]
MRTVLEIFEIQRGRIILFSKGCPSPLLAPLYVVVAALVQAAGLAVGGPLAAVPLQARRGQSPLAVGRWRSPLAGTPQATAPCRLATVGRARGRLLPMRVAAPLQVAGPCPAAPPPRCLRCENTARTRRSYIPVFHIRMEKMKEVNRPPL